MTSDHAQALREMNWTDTEAIAWAEKYYRKYRQWPTRRWRLEGTPGGNSRLLTYRVALKQKAKYGGSLCELIPDTRHYKDLCYSTNCVPVFDEKK